jgi:hypothetical protein
LTLLSDSSVYGLYCPPMMRNGDKQIDEQMVGRTSWSWLTDTLTFSDFLQTFLSIMNSSWHTALILFSSMIICHGIFKYLWFRFCNFHPLSKQWARSEFSDHNTKSCVNSSHVPLHVTTYNTYKLLPLKKTIYVNCGYNIKKITTLQWNEVYLTSLTLTTTEHIFEKCHSWLLHGSINSNQKVFKPHDKTNITLCFKHYYFCLE